MPSRAEAPLLVPLAIHAGGRLLRRVDAQGIPAMTPDAFGPYTFFIFPVAVAVGPMDIFVADAGLGVLFRLDPAMDAMATIPGVQVSQQTRIAALVDGSVVVTDGRLGVPRRYSRGGVLLQRFQPVNTGSRYEDFAVDGGSGKIFGLDRIQRRIEEIQPLGHAASLLPENLLPALPGAMAVDANTLYVFGQDCRCIQRVDLFNGERQNLVEQIGQVAALAAGDGWLAYIDPVERTLRIYRNGALRLDSGFESLKLANPVGLSIARNVLYIADAGSRRVLTYRLRP